MEEQKARHVVDGLRARGVDAHLAEAGVYQFGIRIALGAGRDALWGTDGTAGLAGEVLTDGDLTGFVPELAGSAGWDVGQIVDAISRADYSQPVGRERAVAPSPAPALPIEGGVFRRFIDGFRYRD
jgi:hypothetical protein